MTIQAPAAQQRLRRNRLWLAGGGALAVVCVIAGVWAMNSGQGNAVARTDKTTRDADGAFRPSETQWASLRLAPVRQVSFRDERTTDGKIAINDDTTTPVFSPYSGRVSRLIARPGDHVERGQPLFAIEASEFVQGQNDLVTAVAGVDKAKSRLALAQQIEKRQKELLAIRGGALKDLEQAQSDLVNAQGDMRAAEIALAAARNRLRILGRSDEEIEKLEKTDRIGAETVVAAPIGGTVIQRRVGLGQYINTGGNDPVFTVGNLSTVWLVANVRESDAPKMRLGAPVEVSVLAYPGRTFNAKLSYVAPALDPNTRRLPVRAEIENPGRELLPEMFASFRIVSGDSRLMPAVPQEAVVYEGAQARVWVARPEQKAVVTRPIEVGATTNGLVEIRKGLSVGETVVASGTLFIDRAATRN
ncbi:MAG: efflux RND transporter periplasmic adaptor subunit [Reyranella sp.]|uniref:efflux RND transporter periplasmic adaptor subunit n=1 Tax=Reyranella sp. TaxID=1929291 RepID=UPI001ACC6FD4|nr:efflux RND transporter periplasmic adaptor subunit [Reyranella sp.]MBN9087828.1 efflux RND transporter periplasmic adaptor subunit [Reyranella sp.]